jgi:hypothetical protein
MKIFIKFMMVVLTLFLTILTGFNIFQQAAEANFLDGSAFSSSTLTASEKDSFFQPLGLQRNQLRIGNAYAITMAEEALEPGQVPRMVKGHPRFLVRPLEWKYGLSIAQLRARAKQDPWASQMAKDMKKPPDHPSSSSVITHRALLYLITGDETLVPRIVERILADKPRYNVGGGLVQTALWFDWIYNSPSVTNDQRRQMADKIAQVALECARIYESGHAFDIWTHRGSPGWASDVLAAGLVLDDHPEAVKLRRWGMGYFKKNYFRAWQHNDGSWMHGGSAYNIGMIMPQIMAFWASAVEGEDIYEIIQKDYGNWLEGHLHYMMAEVFPDKTRSDAVAWDYNPKGLRIKGKNFYWAIARAYGNPEFYAFQRWLGEDPKSGPYGRLIRILFYSEAIDAKTTESIVNKPFVKLWGRHGPGYLQMRNKGWAPDGTVIEFKSGDWVWTHSQANHVNSFWIFSKGRLAIQGGAYGLDKCWHGGSGSHYFTQSISSNTMLIFQPGEFTDSGGPGAGDLIAPRIIANHGGQRMRWACGQTCFTFDEYLRRKSEESDIQAGLFETGDILAFEQPKDNAYTYVSGDATMAYNNPKFSYWYKGKKSRRVWKNKPKIDLFTRSMVYLMDTNNLLVFDRVQALDASWRKAWLLHSQGKPEVLDGRLINAEVPGHIEDFNGGTVQITWGDGVLKPPNPDDPGRLFVQTLLPEEHIIRRIGGDGYEAWVNGKNRTGDSKKAKAVIKKLDAGRWRIEVSPAVPRKFDNFLHAIHITDTKTDMMPAAEKIESKDGKMVGAAVGGRLVMFGRRGTIEGEVSYRTPKGKTEHLIVDLNPGDKYFVTGTGEGKNEMTASREGTLRFSANGPGAVRLTPKR